MNNKVFKEARNNITADIPVIKPKVRYYFRKCQFNSLFLSLLLIICLAPEPEYNIVWAIKTLNNDSFLYSLT